MTRNSDLQRCDAHQSYFRGLIHLTRLVHVCESSEWVSVFSGVSLVAFISFVINTVKCNH